MKRKPIFTNKPLFDEVFREMYTESLWCDECGKIYNPQEKGRYDYRDLRPISYLVIDLDNVPENERQNHYNAEFKKLFEAFNNVNPETGNPYVEAIKPYFEKIFRNAPGKMDPNADWNDKNAVRDYLRAFVLLQTPHTLLKTFPKEYLEIFPDPDERERIDAGLLKNSASFNVTNQYLADNGLKLQSVNQLTLFTLPDSILLRHDEYFSTLGADATLNETNEIIIDPTFDPVMTDYLLGNEINIVIKDEENPELDDIYDQDQYEKELWKALSDIVYNTALESRIAESYGKEMDSYFLINGKAIADILDEENVDKFKRDQRAARIITDALTDGKSRVEIARFVYDIDGNYKITYQSLKLDLDKLREVSKNKNFPSNSQRDDALNSESAKRIQEMEHLEYERKLVKTLTKDAKTKGATIKDALPECKIPEHIAHLDNINKKLSEMENEYTLAADAKNSADSNDRIDQHNKSLAVEAVRDRMAHLYCNVMSKIPEEKREDVYAFMKDAFIERVSQKTLDNMETSFRQDAFNANASEYALNHVLFYKCSPILHNNGLYEMFINAAARHIPQKDLEEIIEEENRYLSDLTNNNQVKYFKNEIDRIKKNNETAISDPALREEINKELDAVENEVITSPVEYGRNQGHAVDQIYESIRNGKLEEIHNRKLDQDQYKQYGNYLKSRENDLNRFGLRHIAPKNYGDINIAKAFQDDAVKFKIPENVQVGLRKIIGFMHDKGMLANNASIGEQGSKAYGFRQIHEAHLGVGEAIKSNDANKIREAREKYAQAVSNMRELFKMINDEFHPTTDNLVGNINSYRDEWVPNEFKNDLVVNSLVSGIYNLGLALEQNNVSLDELFENPNEAIFNVIKGYASHSTPNDRLNSIDNLPDIMVDISNGGPTNGLYPNLGVTRNIELLTQLTAGSPEYEHNVFSAMLMQSYDLYVLDLAQSSKISSVQGYMRKNSLETLANLFIVREEHRDFNKLRAFEAVSVDGMEKIPAFNTMEYIEKYKPTPAELRDRIITTLAELSAKGMDNPDQKVNDDHFKRIVRGAQMAAYEFVNSNAKTLEYDNAIDQKAYETLWDIVNNPEKAFENILPNELIEDMKGEFLKDSHAKTIEKDGSNKLKQARKDARKAEKQYNKQADKLQKKIDSLNKKIADAKGDTEKTRADLEKAKADLDLLKQQETARLESAYTDGKLPKDYFDQRREDIQSGKHNNTAPIGVGERPSFKTFKAEFKAKAIAEYTKGANLELIKATLGEKATQAEIMKYANNSFEEDFSAEDIEFFYDRMMESAIHEERKFKLVATGLQPKPTLQASESLKSAEPQNADNSFKKENAIPEKQQQPDKEPLIVEDAVEKQVVEVSQKIDNSEPSKIKEKNP